MKRIGVYAMVIVVLFISPARANAQDEIAQAIAEGIKKVIRAIDLKILRLGCPCTLISSVSYNRVKLSSSN